MGETISTSKLCPPQINNQNQDEENPKLEQILKRNKTNGQVFSWGDGRYGALGIEGVKETSVPLLITTLERKTVRTIHAGRYHSIFITFDDEVYSHGLNNYGQCGVSKSDSIISKPTQIVKLRHKNIIMLASGVFHSHLYSDANKLYSFGNNAFGQIGISSYSMKFSTPKKTRLPFLPHERIKILSCGYFHTVVVTTLNNTYVWGRNTSSQLGITDKNSISSPRLAKFFSYLEIVQVACGSNHTVLIDSNGSVHQLGSNTERQFGGCFMGDYSQRPIQIRIDDNSPITHIATSNNFTCAMSKRGNLWIWGLTHPVGSLEQNVVFPKIVWNNPEDEVRLVRCGNTQLHVLTRSGNLYTWYFSGNILQIPCSSAPPSRPTKRTRASHSINTKNDISKNYRVLPCGETVLDIVTGSYHSHILLYRTSFARDFLKIQHHAEEYYADFRIDMDSGDPIFLHSFFLEERCPILLNPNSLEVIKTTKRVILNAILKNVYAGQYMLDHFTDPEISDLAQILLKLSYTNTELQASLSLQIRSRMNRNNDSMMKKEVIEHFDLLMASQLKYMYQKHYMTDFTIISKQGKRFPVHRAIMAARCPYYDNLFKSNMRECISKEHYIDATSLETDHFIRFCYYEFLDFLPESARWILENGQFYFVDVERDNLYEKCIQILQKTNSLNLNHVGHSSSILHRINHIGKR